MARFEQRIIRPILNLIEKNQEYLTKPENLGQLAKLGFMFEKFWYAGRVAYGYEGRIKKGYECENNPKYELMDTVEYLNDDIENLVYDAWGMHVSNDGNELSFEEIKKIVLGTREPTEFEKKLRKPHKTFDEWVEVLTDKQYRYSSIYPDRRSVANHMLCSFGNGYGYDKKSGTVFSEASGADQDIDSYGHWENAELTPKIRKRVEKIFEVPELKLAVEAQIEAVKEWKRERKEQDKKDREPLYKAILPSLNKYREDKGLTPIDVDDDGFFDAVDQFLVHDIPEIKRRVDALDIESEAPVEEKPAYEYYPWCGYSIITKINDKSHPSYMKAALEICQHTMQNPPQPRKDENEYGRKEREKRVEFAERFVVKYMGAPAIDDNPKEKPSDIYK